MVKLFISFVILLLLNTLWQLWIDWDSVFQLVLNITIYALFTMFYLKRNRNLLFIKSNNSFFTYLIGAFGIFFGSILSYIVSQIVYPTLKSPITKMNSEEMLGFIFCFLSILFIYTIFFLIAYSMWGKEKRFLKSK